MVAPQEDLTCHSPDLLTPEARETAASLISPEFDDQHGFVSGNFSVYYIGSSPADVVHFGLPNMIETWTQLPRSKQIVTLPDERRAKNGFLENMYVQFSERIPGVVLDPENEGIWVDTATITDKEREQVYTDWSIVFEGIDPENGGVPIEARVNEALGRYAISQDYAAGLYYLKESGIGGRAAGVKGHMTGLFSWGFTVPDQNGKPIIYDDESFDIIARAMLLKARWQQGFLEEINPNAIFHLDEPYLVNAGSAFISGSSALEWLDEESKAIKGNIGAHCCGATDYSRLFNSPLRIVALDLTGENWDGDWSTANFAESFVTSAPSAGVKDFLRRGGIIALGVVPYRTSISPDQVTAHALSLFAELGKRGIDVRPFIRQFIITPTCGGGSETVEAASHAFSSSVLVASQLQKELLGK